MDGMGTGFVGQVCMLNTDIGGNVSENVRKFVNPFKKLMETGSWWAWNEDSQNLKSSNADLGK